MRYWSVAGGLLSDERGLLLVANKRLGGSIDWTTPGGVVDEGETPIEALTREVREETGLVVDDWKPLSWTVEVDFVDLEMHLDVRVHSARTFTGQIVLDDPDGIVTAAEFLQSADVLERLRSSPMWVAEPLSLWVDDPWVEPRHFSYAAQGTRASAMRAERVGP